MKIIKFTNVAQLEKLYKRDAGKSRKVQERVGQILDDVKQFGDDAVLKYTRKFDGVKLNAKQLRVSEREISGAYQNITPNFVSSLKTVFENINRFYRKTLKKSWKIRDAEGTVRVNSSPRWKKSVYTFPPGQRPWYPQFT
jgi:histidinol dehydrogenase